MITLGHLVILRQSWMKLYKMVINWDNFKLLFTAPYYKQEYSITHHSNSELKFKKFTKIYQPKISTNVHPTPKEFTRFHQPRNPTEFHQCKISTNIHQGFKIFTELHKLIPNTILFKARQKLKLTTQKY